jgi:hypothetical protein
MNAKAMNIAVYVQQRLEINIHWQPPAKGWVRLNTDGVSVDGRSSGCGGFISDVCGKWWGGFSKFIGKYSAYMAELWGAFEGLKLARSKGYEKV